MPRTTQKHEFPRKSTTARSVCHPQADKDDGKNDVKKIMDTWTLQRGYPLIRLTRTGNEVVATQEVFLQLDQTLADDDFGNLG